MRTKHRNPRAGLSLVEVVVSTMLVGLVLVGALKGVGAVIRGRVGTSDSGFGKHLASQLMAEIMENDYLEPVDPPTFGRETSESGGNRTDWDDVDDYHLWGSRPPTDRLGMALPNSTNWQRDVVVEWVDPANPAVVVGSDQGVKRVTITVKFNDVVIVEMVGLRSDKYFGSAP